jgi:hypothetical protein
MSLSVFFNFPSLLISNSEIGLSLNICLYSKVVGGFRRKYNDIPAKIMITAVMNNYFTFSPDKDDSQFST